MRFGIFLLAFISAQSLAFQLGDNEVSTKHLPDSAFGNYTNHRADGRTWTFNKDGTFSTTLKGKTLEGEWGAVQKTDGTGIELAPASSTSGAGLYKVVTRIGYSNTRWYFDPEVCTYFDRQGVDRKLIKLLAR
ncbi:hypothetical protein A3709_19885 [Halioglobus sp. HI00S01]|uniref:hypothetical protein n=1 Tax=Halioglobus sp. HI00S01 TaxID=1822214 RepID=UPI0007C32AA1|nr:hypothetical protein [Halioglobus sp. HI00S01]KZX57886.1 hypothetical protein A3709_19885 [Halioglobus sp. HI00S01]